MNLTCSQQLWREGTVRLGRTKPALYLGSAATTGRGPPSVALDSRLRENDPPEAYLRRVLPA